MAKGIRDSLRLNPGARITFTPMRRSTVLSRGLGTLVRFAHCVCEGRMIRRSIPCLVLALLVGCGVLLPLNPVTQEARVVQNAHDSSKTVTIVDGMVWYNLDRTKGDPLSAGYIRL
jgi:hypothetical protein